MKLGGYLFNNSGTFPDFTLVCSTKKWLVHRAVLTRIPYFYSMFQHEEFIENKTRQHIIDYSYPNTVEYILHKIYEIADVCLSLEEKIEAYYLADRWCLPLNQVECLNYIIQTNPKEDPTGLIVWQFLKTINPDQEVLSGQQQSFLRTVLYNHDYDPDPILCRRIVEISGEKGWTFLEFLGKYYNAKKLTQDEVDAALKDPSFDITKINADLRLLRTKLRGTYYDTLLLDYCIEKILIGTYFHPS